MSDDLKALEDWAGGLLAQLQPAKRRQLNQQLARELRQSQQKRITTQKNPDGTAFAPRKPQQREKQGRIKRKMFTKLKAAKHLRLQSDANSIALAFIGRTARLARVHQYGLRDRPGRGSPQVQYARRELLGLTADELDHIRTRLLDHITSDL